MSASLTGPRGFRNWYRKKSWPLRRWLRNRWDQLRAPWPIVDECFRQFRESHSCEQCEPTHVHVWKAWENAPKRVSGGYGVPVRCTICGARKCDLDNCDSRRHDHIHVEGVALPHMEGKTRA